MNSFGMPDDCDDPMPLPVDKYRDRMQDCRTNCADVTRQMLEKILQGIGATLEEIASAHTKVAFTIAGFFEHHFQKIAACHVKTSKKYKKKLDNTYGDIIYHCSQLGISYPTPTELQACLNEGKVNVPSFCEIESNTSGSSDDADNGNMFVSEVPAEIDAIESDETGNISDTTFTPNDLDEDDETLIPSVPPPEIEGIRERIAVPSRMPAVNEGSVAQINPVQRVPGTGGLTITDVGRDIQKGVGEIIQQGQEAIKKGDSVPVAPSDVRTREALLRLITALPDWADPAVCQKLTAAVKQLNVGQLDRLSALLGFSKAGADGKWLVPDSILPFVQSIPEWVGRPLIAMLMFLLDNAGWLIQAIPLPEGANKTALLPLSLLRMGLGFIEKWIGPLPEPAMVSLIQTINEICPQMVIDPQTAVFLANRTKLSTSEFNCLIRANGQSDAKWRDVRDLSDTRLNPFQLTQLYRRGLFDGGTWSRQMAELGVTSLDQLAWYERYSDQLPGLSDLIRMMIRDVGDENEVKRVGLDDEFDKKWTGALARLGEGQGVSTDIARLYWRAHWQLPSPTQLYEMLHRLRPGAVAPEVVTTADDVRKTLIQNDILPFFVDRLMAVSFHPMTRTDVQRAYFIDTLTREDVYKSYLDLGYTDDAAEKLTRFTERLKVKRQQRETGTKTIAYWKKQFESMLIGEEEFRDIAAERGYAQEVVDGWVNESRMAQTAGTRAAFLKSMQKQYLTGAYDRADMNGILAMRGYATDQVERIMDRMDAIKAGKSKEPTAAMLVGWVKAGIIGIDELLARLMRLGYLKKDAENIVEAEGAKASKAKVAPGQRAPAGQKKAEQEGKRTRKILTKPEEGKG